MPDPYTPPGSPVGDPPDARKRSSIAAVALGFFTDVGATMIFGVLYGVSVSAYLIDAVIGFSVVYKALDNMRAYERWFGIRPNTKAAVLIFGFFHGFGLATKLQEFSLFPDGLVVNLLAFNVGVEIGQMLALGAILIAMGYWRWTSSFRRHAFTANAVLMSAGFILFGYQLAGYFVLEGA